MWRVACNLNMVQLYSLPLEYSQCRQKFISWHFLIFLNAGLNEKRQLFALVQVLFPASGGGEGKHLDVWENMGVYVHILVNTISQNKIKREVLCKCFIHVF